MIGGNGFGGVLISVKLGGASILLGVISTTCVIYGYRIHRRLQHIGNQMNDSATRPNYVRTSQLLARADNVYDNLDEERNLHEKPAPNPNASSARILKILCLMEFFSLAAIGAQVGRHIAADFICYSNFCICIDHFGLESPISSKS
jgi:hypothetical protein